MRYRIAERLGLAFAATLLVALPAAAQTTGEPCVYTDLDGTLVITDRVNDPRCEHLRRQPDRDDGAERPAQVARVPGRLRVTSAMAEIISLAHDVALRHRVDHRLVESLVEMESAYDPGAVSSRGALGLMQLMPAVARMYGVHDAFDARQNLDAGVRHLRRLLMRYRGDLERSLAAYNAGPGAVDRYGGVPPYRETESYVRRVLYRYRQRVDGMSLH